MDEHDVRMTTRSPSGIRPAVLAAGLVLLAMPTAAAPPADAFCVILIEGVDGFRTVRVLVDEETTLEERRELFNGTDTDADGWVTPEESSAFRQQRTTFWGNQTELGLRGVELVAEGQASPALHATTWRQVGHTFHKQDHVQPSSFSDPADFETQEVREVRFDPPVGSTLVQVKGGRDLTQPPAETTSASASASTSYTVTIEYVVVRAPPGWIVHGIEGYSYDGPFRKEPNAQEVDVPAFDTKQPYVLTFQRVAQETAGPTTVTVTQVVERHEEQRGAPAPALAALLGGLAIAIAIRRRL